MSPNRRRPFPLLTAATLGPTVVLTATRLLGDGPLDALRRDPDALGRGEVWRLLSPVLVQSDANVLDVLLVFVVCAAIGVLAERLLPPRRWLLLYLSGALVGHALGEAFQPLQGGTSVAFVGILGGLGGLAVLEQRPELARFRLHALAGIPLAILDTALGDIHGGAYLVGFAIAAVWARDGDVAPSTRFRWKAEAQRR